MTGKKVSHFEIIGKLGEGGMGVVYEAVDSQLGRRVALKILPPEVNANPARKQRFIQEAKAASSLNHPNIITIYEIGSADGVDFIAMELVKGQTIEDLLNARRLKTAEALKLAVQMADALAAAHGVGIVHRDFKPANVMVTESGLVKVLDFGLAKLSGQGDYSDEGETQTDAALTEEGSVVGSAAYMSPEQAEGRKVDESSDIFSLGTVLYEMLSGKRAFRADSRMATIAAVLTQEPPALEDLPAELQKVVARCLRKDLAKRTSSMADVKLSLEELREESASSPAIPAPPHPAKRNLKPWMWLAAGGVLVAIAASVALMLRPPPGPPIYKEIPLTTYPGFQADPTLSPDGNQFAFVWDGGEEGAKPQLYVSIVGRGTPLRLTNTEERISKPAWSPDGQMIAYVRSLAEEGQIIFVVPALGGQERKIAKGSDPAWSADGNSIVFSQQKDLKTALYIQPVAGGETQQLTQPPPSGQGDYDAAVSPDGQQLVYVRQTADFDQDLFVADFKDGRIAGTPRNIFRNSGTKSSPVWTPDGKEVLYISGPSSIGLSLNRIPAGGGTPILLPGLGENAQRLAIAPKGKRLVIGRSWKDYSIWRIPLPAAGTGLFRRWKSDRFRIQPQRQGSDLCRQC